MSNPIKGGRLLRPLTELPQLVSYITAPVSAGFPSPAGDYLEGKLDLNRLLITHPVATYIFRVKGSSMAAERIWDGDLLIIDTAVNAKSGDIILAVLDGSFVVKKIAIHKDHIVLVSVRSDRTPLLIKPERDFAIWGKVIYSIHRHK